MARNQGPSLMDYRRQMMAVQEPEQNWYSGAFPTRSEVTARIINIGQQNRDAGEQLWNAFQQLQAGNNSPWKNPYEQATSMAVKSLSDLGFDMSKGINQDWLQQNSWLQQYYRNGDTSMSPLAPSSKSTPQEDAAYWWYKAYSDEATTQKAENEWKALQEEINYWTNRSDRNLSDDEILGKIDWSNYGTLAKMDEGINTGVPLSLNRAVGYSKDALKGVIWAARNNGGSGNPYIDSVYSTLGVGNQYHKNEEISRKLDPRSEDYSPYSVGSTIDDAALYFGVSDFGPNWLQDNRDVLAGNDATAKKFYNQVYKAEETTRKAEEELQSMWNDIDYMLKRNYTNPDKILNGLLDDYSTLKKMDESRKSGNIMDTTRAIDYRWEDVEAEVRRRCAEEEKKDDAATCTANVNNRFNIMHPQTATDAAVKDSQNKAIQDFATNFTGTPEEMITFEFAQDAGYEQAVTGIHDAVVNGEVNPAKDYEYAFQNADKKAAGSFFKAQKAMTPYLELQAEIDELKRDRSFTKGQIELDNMLYDYEVLSQYNAPFSPSDTINIHGLTYSVAADYDPETGKFRQGGIQLLPQGGEHNQEADAYAQNVAQRWAAENGSGIAVLKIGDLNFLMQNNSGNVTVSRIREQDAGIASKAYPVVDATEDIDEETQAAVDQWMGNLPDFSQLGGKGNNRHLTADELNDYREYLDFVEHDIKNKEEMLGTIQKDYDDAKAELDAIDLAYQNASDLAEMNGITPSSIGSIYPVLQYGWELYSNPTKREFPTISGYDFALQQGADYEDVADTAYQDIKASQDELKAIEYALGRMEESGITLDRDMLKAYQNRKDELDRNIKGAQYFLLRGSDDFMEVADAKRQEILNGWNNPTITDVDRQAVDYETYKDIHGGSMAYDISLTAEEWDEYLYILEKSGREAAMEYYNYMTNPDFGIIHNRNMEALQERTKNLVDSGFLGGAAATAMAVISAPAQLGGAAYTLLSWLQGKDPNPNNPTYAAGVFNQTTKAEVKNNITKAFGEGTVGSWLANLGYDAFTTAAESFLNAQTFGAAMPELGNVFASNFLSAMPMGLEAAGNEAREVYLRGGSREQAMAMFGVSLMAETLTETITYGNIKEAMNLGGEEGAKTLKQIIANALKDGFLEEAPGEAISEALESGLDSIIMGRLSNYEANVEAYKEQGYLEDDAREMATMDALKDIAYAGLLGAVSGVSSTTVASLMSGGLTEAAKIQILAANQGMSAENFVAQMNQQMIGEQAQNTLAETAPQETQQEASQPPVGEVAGPSAAEQMQQQQEAQRQQTELEQTTKKISALSEALEGNKSAQSAAVAASLVPDGVDENGLNTVSAAAQHLMSIYGENTIPIVQNVLLAAQKAGMTEPVTTALITGALSNGATAQALAQITPTTQMTPAMLEGLVQRAQADMQNPDIMNGIRQTVADNMIAQEEKNLVAQGAANGNAPYEQAVTQAKQKEADARDNLDKANADMEAASKEVDNLYQQVEQNPGDDATVAELNRAITALQGKAAVVNEYEQSVANAENATKQAQDNLSRKQDETNTAIRQQAQENVAQKQQALAEQKEAEALENADFSAAYDAWDKVSKGKQFNLGTPSEVLLALGVPDVDIMLSSDKIVKIKKKHPNMTDDVIKQIPSILEDPLLVMKSRTVSDRITMFGELTDANGSPVLAVLTTTPTTKNNINTDFLVLNSAYGKDTKLQNFIDQSEIIYQDKNRASEWAAGLRLYLPSESATSGSNQSIAQQQENVNKSEGIVYTNDQVPVKFHYTLANANELITSNNDNFEANPNYPAELQPRDRTRQANMDQVSNISRNLNPARLGESADIQNGAPIVGSDNVVESGNGRTMAVRQAMEANSDAAKRYTEWLRQNAEKFGLNPNDVTDRSVLVRVRDTELDRTAFVRAANESTTAGYSASETARTDAEKLTPRMMELFSPGENGKLDNAENHSFALAFMEEVIPESERGTYQQSDGTISQQGWDRIRNAVFQRAYGSERLTQLFSEATDGAARNVMSALLQAAPRAVQLQEAVKQGAVYDVGIGNKIADAVERYIQVKKSGQDVSTYLGQIAMPGMAQEEPGVQALMRVFDEYKRSSKKIADALRGTMDALEDAGDPRMANFLEDNPTPDLESLVKQGVTRALRGFDNIQALHRGKGSQQNNGQAAPQTNTNTKPKRSPAAIATKLAGDIGIGHSVGTRKMNNLPKSVLGFYETRAKYIAVRSKQAGNYQVTMHEIFHALGQKLGLTGTQAMVNNLPDAFKNAYTAAELPGEAFAEFGWHWMKDRAEAVAFAGDAFVTQFEEALRRSSDNKAVLDAQQDLRAWLNANANDKIGAVIRNRSDINKDKFGFKKIIASLVDDTAAAEDVNKAIREQNNGRVNFDADVRKNALLKNFSSRVASAILTENLTDSAGDIIGDSLAKRFEDAGITAKDFDLLSRYMLAKHSVARDAQNKPVFDMENLTPAERDAFVADVEQNHPEIVRAEQAFQEYRKQLMQAWMVDTGYLSQEAFDKMNAMYPNYVPTQRVMDNASASKRKGNGANYRIRRATGGSQDIINPIDSFVDMVNNIVTMVKANNAAVAWDNAYHQYEGLGIFGREITEDMKRVTVNTEGVQQQVESILNGQVSDDVLQQVLDSIGEQQVRWQGTGNVNMPNVLTVQRADGTKAYYEMYDTELYKLLASQRDTDVGPTLRFLSKATRAMSALTTGSNPVFAIRNFMRDFQNSVNYGSWASNYATGAAKWIRAAYDVWRNSGEYRDYAALGGGGWTRIDTGTKKGTEEYRAGLFKGYETQDAKHTAKWLADKAWSAITLERLNEIIEQTSRYAEYKYGSQDKSTAEGKQQAFLNAQEATVDFARRGNGKLASELKAVIPFFAASMQGVYRTGRTLTEAERSRAPQRFIKTVINTALVSAICNALTMRNSDDDEKEAYINMSDELKAQHLYLPNFAPDVLGQQPLIRIPLAQDPLTYAINGVVSNAMWNGTNDDPVIELGAIANTIIDNLNPVHSTILDPIIALGTNKNWYGSNIVPTRMKDWETTTQYTDETPDIFVTMGRALGMSPLKVQYMAEQYTGFLGQMLIPAISKDERTGELGGFNAALTAARKKLTSDPLVSNDVVSSFYDGAEILDQVKKAADNDRPMNMLRRGLTPDEATEAYEEAKSLIASSGIVAKTKKAISSYYNEIDEINANQSLNDQQKYQLTSEIRKQMIADALVAQEAIGAFQDKYVTGRNVVTDALFAGDFAHIPTAYEKMDQTFKNDSNQDYMKKATEVWEKTENENALPHPLYTFSSGKVEYEVADADRAEYNERYKIAYDNYLAKNSAGWETMTDAEKLEVLKQAHSKAHSAAKDWYKKVSGGK